MKHSEHSAHADEENNLPHALGSVRGLFDEIVVVDTGSTDRTKEIALEFGARVFDFVWIDDFSAARNAALDHATGDYDFWLDADDVIDAAERVKLSALLHSLGASDAGRPPLSEDSDTAGADSPAASPFADLATGRAGTTPPDPPFARGET